MTIISYYDKIQDFKFDSAKKTFSWNMPFDWNASRIEKNNIFVHEEVRIPKSLPGIGDAAYFNATANGEILTGRKLAIDPYTFESELTFHYLLNKNDILRMTRNMEGSSNPSQVMSFSLAPNSEGPPDATTSEMVTDTGGIGVFVEWSPNPLDADKDSTVKLHFSDAFSGGPLNANVRYQLSILNVSTGSSVYTKDNLTARDGADIQTIDFPKNEKYDIQVAVKGLVREGQQVEDTTRNGIARGVVIVPEFPATAAVGLLVIGTIIGSVAVLTRKSSV
jgi:hypothetical protein